jgi:hypothetical protein
MVRHAGKVVALFLAAACCAGCGTTRRSDTARTATEQMLLSDAVDRAVSRIDFGLMAGKEVFLDNSYLGSTVDKEYITSTLRQHMLACGCILKDKKEDAKFVVEARAGAIGTDRHDLLFGVPATSVSFGALVPIPGMPTQLPEIALAKRTDQMGVAKIAVFAYERDTGIPVWQSGTDAIASQSRDLWVFGAGPFQRGNIYDGPMFAGEELHVPLVGNKNKKPPVRVARERTFNSPALAKKDDKRPTVANSQRKLNSGRQQAADSAPSRVGSAHQQDGERQAQASVPAQAATTAQSQPAPPAPTPRSQFEPLFASPPLELPAGAAGTMVDRRWPAPTRQ